MTDWLIPDDKGKSVLSSLTAQWLSSMSDGDASIDEPYGLMVHVSRLIRSDECGQCLRGKAAALEMLVTFVHRLKRSEKRVSIITALSILCVADEARPQRQRSRGERQRYYYYLPFVGRVCKSAFLNGFGVSAPTVARYRRMIREGAVLDEGEDHL